MGQKAKRARERLRIETARRDGFYRRYLGAKRETESYKLECQTLRRAAQRAQAVADSVCALARKPDLQTYAVQFAINEHELREMQRNPNRAGQIATWIAGKIIDDLRRAP